MTDLYRLLFIPLPVISGHILLHLYRSGRAVVPLHGNGIGALPAYDSAAGYCPIVGAAGYGGCAVGIGLVSASHIVSRNNGRGYDWHKIEQRLVLGCNSQVGWLLVNIFQRPKTAELIILPVANGKKVQKQIGLHGVAYIA